MRTFCLTLYETPDRLEKCKKHFAECGIDAEFVYGINAKTAGLKTINPYEVDAPNSGFNIGEHGVGIWCGFLIMYSILAHLPDEHFFVLEHDAEFEPNWKERFDKAMQDVPQDFDFLFIGSCCCKSFAFKQHIKGEVYRVKYPMCNHATVIAKKCLPYVIETLMKKCWAPLDIQLAREVFPQLKVYAIMPTAVHQFDTVLQP
jgi:hypothetical protein